MAYIRIAGVIYATAFRGATAWEFQVGPAYVKVNRWRFSQPGHRISFGWDVDWKRDQTEG